MSNRLLDRQVSLLEYLSSTTALFGDLADMPLDPALQTVDRGLLRLEARSCCEKRVEKIFADFPHTFEILAASRKLILREFVEVSPPTSTSSLVNAREFYEFLSVRWRHEPAKPAYLPDVASCEFAIVTARNTPANDGMAANDSARPKPDIRRGRGVVPVRCAYDIRLIFETGLRELVPPQRDTLLVVTLAAGFPDVKIVELDPIAFELLARLDDWADPTTLNSIELRGLVSRLAEHQLIEVRR
jgi:hypothetical protein